MICVDESTVATGLVGLLGAAWLAIVRTVEPTIELFVALILVDPIPAGVARPVPAFTVAFAVSLEDQLDVFVITPVVPSL